MKLPISAIVVFRNERALLEECLKRLNFVSQLILVDMQSTDGARQIAERYSREIYECAVQPTADPVRVWAMQFARYEWILIVDPDEHYPPKLVEDLAEAMKKYPEAGGFRLPWRFYFKGKYLPGTVWGGSRLSKLVLIHRERGRLLPTCNRISEVLPGFQEVIIPNTDENHIRHYWSNSYLDLLRKHFYRYPWRDAQRLRGEGECFSWRRIFTKPVREFWRSVRDHDGWRMGMRGLVLSLIYGAYHLAIELCLLGVQVSEKRKSERYTRSPANWERLQTSACGPVKKGVRHIEALTEDITTTLPASSETMSSYSKKVAA